MPRKALSVFIILCVIAAAAAGSSLAEENKSAHEKLDIVFVLDASGSMRESDPDRLTADAVKMLIGMMPAKDCRVGIVSFNVEPKIRTRNSEGKDALIGLEKIEDTDYLKDRLDQIRYMDDTGIGNGLFKAAEMLDTLASPDSRKAIILFTDGMDDLEGKTAMQECLENEQKAIEWAVKNGCPVYCIGLDFEGSDGVSSLGENGEGFLKLKGIAEPTGGFAKATTDVQKIEELFIEILANIFSIYYNESEIVSRSDGSCETTIQVGPNANEVNIRMSGAKTSTLEQFKLYDPDGNLTELDNNAGIRFDSDKMSSNIKMILPKAGEWKLVLKGEDSENIRVGLLEHYYLNIESSVRFAGEDPNILYTGDEAVISACLTSGGEIITDGDIYDAVSAANARVVPLHDPGGAFDVNLTREGASFKGSFKPEKAGEYTVELTLGTKSFYRTQSTVIQCQERPAAQTLRVVKGFEDLELEIGEQITIGNVLSHIEYDPNAKITILAAPLYEEGSSSVAYDPAADTLTIKGVSGGETASELTFSDSNGNTETVSFKVLVKEPPKPVPKPVFRPIILLYIAAGAAAACGIAYAAYKNRNTELKGYIVLHGVRFRSGDTSGSITASYNEFGDIRDGLVFSASLFSDKKDRSLASLLSETAEKLESCRDGDHLAVYDFLISEAGQRMLKAAKKVRLEGSFKGGKGIFFICSSGNRFVFINGKTVGRFNLDVGSNLEVMILSDPGMNGGTSLALQLEYKKIMRHWTRTFVTPEY